MTRPCFHWLLLLAQVAMWGSGFLLTKIAVALVAAAGATVAACVAILPVAFLTEGPFSVTLSSAPGLAFTETLGRQFNSEKEQA